MSAWTSLYSALQSVTLKILQLRMQHRRSQEQMSERNLLSSVNKIHTSFVEQNGTLGQNKPEDFMKCKAQNKIHKVAAMKIPFSEDGAVESDELKEKKARLAEDLNEKILHRPGPLELVKKNILPIANGMKNGLKDHISSSSDTFTFDDDITSSSSSSNSSSPRFAPSPGLSINLSPTPTSTAFQFDSPQIIQVNQPVARLIVETDPLATKIPAIHHSAQTSSGVTKVPAKSSDTGKSQRPKKLKDSKPKVKKLKYHQYIPPDQKADRSPVAMDAAYSRLLQQQQVFLQLQILNQQQNQTFCVQTVHPLTTSISADQVISFTGTTHAGAPPINLSSTSSTAMAPVPNSPTNPPLKPEVLPTNLDDLTVSELRQHLRKRGLPVSGTKPALLERLRPYQVPCTKTIPAPIQSAGFLTPVIELPSIQNQSTFESTTTASSVYHLPPSDSDSPHKTSKTTCNATDSSNPRTTIEENDTTMQGIDEDQVLLEKQKVIENLTWKLLQEQKQAEDLRIELEMHKRLKNRRKNDRLNTRVSIKTEDELVTLTCAKEHTENTPYMYNINSDRPDLTPPVQEQMISPGVNKSCMVLQYPTCEVIGQDFELPMQITASPESPVLKPRSFEEELQEAIRKAQMALSQSIDDILEDEPLLHTDKLMDFDSASMENKHSDINHQNGNFVKQIQCCLDSQPLSIMPNSAILEFPVSGNFDFLSGQESLPAVFSPDQIELPSSPDHQENNMSPSSSSSSSTNASFDPADWLDALTSGSTSNFGPSSPVGSSIFSTDIFDSPDLSINRMIDLMVEQW
ncbi:MEF2-activating motif and SAP domain-containing transcriptional regulator isoform X2 [Engystomops pustulosus]|uniref:MEF2-activating motif and SAP domain-containing transcriptional regulator isoform X2 n=1 Tax=Engystomops pustulosus TaxID=76066 RepID=UPI003AFA312B